MATSDVSFTYDPFKTRGTYPDLFSIVKDVYNHIFKKENIGKQYFKRIISFKNIEF